MNMTKEQFKNKCKDEIQKMSNITRTTFDECADMMYTTCSSFESIGSKEAERIIDELNKVSM